MALGTPAPQLRAPGPARPRVPAWLRSLCTAGPPRPSPRAAPGQSRGSAAVPWLSVNLHCDTAGTPGHPRSNALCPGPGPDAAPGRAGGRGDTPVAWGRARSGPCCQGTGWGSAHLGPPAPGGPGVAPLAVLFMLFIQVHFSVRYLKRRVCIIFSYNVAFAICHCLGSAFPKGSNCEASPCTFAREVQGNVLCGQGAQTVMYPEL